MTRKSLIKIIFIRFDFHISFCFEIVFRITSSFHLQFLPQLLLSSDLFSQFHLFSDESLESGGTLAHQTLDTAHHGIAEPLDGVVLASHAAASGDAPDGISVFELHGDHFDDAKIAVAERLATVVGHPDVAEFAAFSYPGGNLYALDPEAGTATQVDWRDGAVDGDGDPVSALARGFDGHGEHLLVLDSNGDLHVLESSDWSHRGSIAVLDSVPASGPAPALAVSAAGDQAFVSDPAAPAIHIIDLEALSLEAVPLAFPPTGLAWTGVGEAHDHDGHDDHDH